MAKIITSLSNSLGAIHNNLEGLNEGDYIHLTQIEKNKFDTVENGAEVNVNADWNSISGDSEILNKPTEFIPISHNHNVSDISGTKVEFNNSLTDGNFLFQGDLIPFEPLNYDLVNFTNTSVDPFVKVSQIPEPQDITGKENIFNKQNSLTLDGTGVNYPTVDATNIGLALKANINNPTFTGVLTNTNNIVSNNIDGVPSKFGVTPTNFLPVNLLDVLSSVNINFTSGDGHYRAISAIGEFSGTSSSSGTITGLSSRGTTSATSTGDLTLTTFGGGFKGGRFRAAHRGSGTISKASGVSADIQNTGGIILNSVVFNAEPAYVALDKTTTSHSAFLAEGGSVLGTLTNNHGLYINSLIGGANRWGIYQVGSTDKNYFAGNSLFGTNTDNNQGVAQFNGNITISDGTLSNHAVTKGQLDLKQNTLTNPITGTGTTNTIPKWITTSTQDNSNFSDDGTLTASSTDMTINSMRFGRGLGNISTNIGIGGDNYAPTITAGFNVALGQGALFSSTGTFNLAIGAESLYYLTTSAGNVGIGRRAGMFILDGITPNSSSIGSIFIGANSKPNANNESNQIVIARNGIGNGSNSTVIGVALTTKTTLYGRLLVNSLTDNGVDSGQFSGSVLSTQYKLSALNTAPATSTSTGTFGEIRVTSDYIYVCIATNTWVRTVLLTF